MDNSLNILLYYFPNEGILNFMVNDLFLELKEMISIQWTIFGISITIFLVWSFLLLKNLKSKKPQASEELSPIKRFQYLHEKGVFYQNASASFSSITFLTINVLVLIFATGCVYVTENKVNLFNQSCVILSFYFCTNVLVEIFLDILKAIIEEKREILKDTKVSAQEVQEKNQIKEKTEKLLVTIDEIEKSKVFTEEQKEEIRTKLLFEYIGIEKIVQIIAEKEKLDDNKNKE